MGLKCIFCLVLYVVAPTQELSQLHYIEGMQSNEEVIIFRQTKHAAIIITIKSNILCND